MYNIRSLNLCIAGGCAHTRLSLVDSRWHFVVVTWQGSTRTASIIIDGRVRWTGRVGRRSAVRAGGTFVIGQEQDCPGGCFSAAESFAGGAIGGFAVRPGVMTPAQAAAARRAQVVGHTLRTFRISGRAAFFNMAATRHGGWLPA